MIQFLTLHYNILLIKITEIKKKKFRDKVDNEILDK